MARNTEKNLYITIGIPRNSPMLKRLQKESGQSGTSLSKLIPVKLQELYSGLPLVEVPVLDVIDNKPNGNANALAFLDSEGDS